MRTFHCCVNASGHITTFILQNKHTENMCTYVLIFCKKKKKKHLFSSFKFCIYLVVLNIRTDSRTSTSNGQSHVAVRWPIKSFASYWSWTFYGPVVWDSDDPTGFLFECLPVTTKSLDIQTEWATLKDKAETRISTLAPANPRPQSACCGGWFLPFRRLSVWDVS